MSIPATNLWIIDQNAGMTITDSMKWERINTLRKSLLVASDWTQLSDVVLSSADIKNIKDWRKTIRNITSGQGTVNPDTIVFPDPPFSLNT